VAASAVAAVSVAVATAVAADTIDRLGVAARLTAYPPRGCPGRVENRGGPWICGGVHIAVA
jgi:hypothetical protein